LERLDQGTGLAMAPARELLALANDPEAFYYKATRDDRQRLLRLTVSRIDVEKRVLGDILGVKASLADMHQPVFFGWPEGSKAPY
jgi:hypothetical protein